MDQSNTELKKYFDELPKVVQTAIVSNEWQKRIDEIAVKYALSQEQNSSLGLEILLVVIGMEPEEDLIANIQQELSVSNILASQITEEVNNRIFQYIGKLAKEKQTEQPKPQPQKQRSDLLSKIETMANNIPSSEEIKVEKHQIHTAPPPINLPSEESSETEMEDKGYEIKEEKIKNIIVNDNHQNIPPVSNIVSQPSFIDTKLNTVVKSEQQKVVLQEKPIQKSYTADPYREPLE